MSYYDIALIAIASFFAGATNAIAGGGTFFSFPALLAVGVPPVVANATNSVALFPASISSAFAFKDELKEHKFKLIFLGLVALIGAILGALLLLHISNKQFNILIPYLLLFATIIFAFSNKISLFIGIKNRVKSKTVHTILSFILFLVSIYGGFFGAGVGILLIAYLLITEVDDINQANALKNYLSAIFYTVSTVVFLSAGAISYKHLFIMLIASTAGGYYGAKFAKSISHKLLKKIIIIVGFELSVYYFK